MNLYLKQIADWQTKARHAGWSVSKLAGLCGVSVRNLERYFLEMHGRRPKDLLVEWRQRQAWELLCDGSTIKETATVLGYHHAEHFSRDFKSRWGCCPSERCEHCQNASSCLKRGKSGR